MKNILSKISVNDMLKKRISLLDWITKKEVYIILADGKITERQMFDLLHKIDTYRMFNESNVKSQKQKKNIFKQLVKAIADNDDSSKDVYGSIIYRMRVLEQVYILQGFKGLM